MNKLKVIIPLLAVFIFIAIAGTITIAGSGDNSGAAAEKLQGIELQKKAVLDAIAKKDQKAADAAYSKLITEFAQDAGLSEAVYAAGKSYQYSAWNTAKANELHNYNIQKFPNTFYAMLSNVEIVRSYIRDGKSIADAEVEKWLNAYKDQPDRAMGIYLLARAYAGNNKGEKALQLFENAIANYPKQVYGLLSQVRYNTTKKDFDAADKAADNVIASFPDNEDVKENIRDLANLYRDKKQYARAIHFYKAEIDNWPKYDDPVVPYREAIYCYINMKDLANAESLINSMQNNLDGNPKLARTNFDIGNYFLNTAKDASSALKVHKYNADNYTSDLEAMWSQAALVWYYVRHNDLTNADAEYTKLLNVYKSQATLPKEVFQIGDIYRDEKKNYEKAISLYKYQLENWPDYGEPTDTYRKLACTYIDMKDSANADAVIAQMQTKFAKNPKLARANFDIGNYFLNTAKDPNNALKVHKYNADNYTGVMEAMWSQAALVWYHVRHDDSANAEIEYAKLLEVFKDHKTLPKEVFQIGDIYTEVGDTAKARTLHNEVLKKWPESEYVFNAKTGLIKADFADGNDSDALAGLDTLITDYNDRSDIANAVFILGEEYYTKALDERFNTYQQLAKQNNGKGHNKNLVNNSKTTSEFNRTVNIWSRIINNLPVSNITAQAYMFTAEIYQNLYQYQQAIEYFNAVVDNWPNYENAWIAQHKITKAYKEMAVMGEVSSDEAEILKNEAYQKLVELFPDCPAAEKAIRELNISNKNAARDQEVQK